LGMCKEPLCHRTKLASSKFSKNLGEALDAGCYLI
jgi:hypothetical protein